MTQAVDWHRIGPEETVERLKTDREHGLSPPEAAARLATLTLRSLRVCVRVCVRVRGARAPHAWTCAAPAAHRPVDVQKESLARVHRLVWAGGTARL